MLDTKELPSQTLEPLLAFWQQRAGAHCRAGASRHFVRSKKRIKDRTSQSAGLSILLFILNTH
jgi:hypothetical protein